MSQPANFGNPVTGPIAPSVMYPRINDSLAALLNSNSGATRPAYAVQGTVWHDTDLLASTPLLMYDGTGDRVIAVEDGDGNITISGNALIVETQATPASASAAGVKGTIVHDADYIYICTATDTWKRVAIATW